MIDDSAEAKRFNDNSHGYAFLLNVGSIPLSDGTEILPGHTLRRAVPSEIESIKKTLTRNSPSTHSHVNYFWEHQWPHHGTVQLLFQKEWRYFVIEFKGMNNIINQLSNVFVLSRAEPLIGFSIIYQFGQEGLLYNNARLFHALDQAQWGDWTFHTITEADVSEFTDLYHCFQNHKHELLDLNRVVSQMADLNCMSYKSPLRFLGYFALLESLLTHKPQQTDPYDSITRQVKKKLALLDRRFKTRLDYTQFGSNINADTVWSKMYAYRSAIAHGGTPNFASDLQLLGSSAKAFEFLKETTKAVARQALFEPELLADLREC